MEIDKNFNKMAEIFRLQGLLTEDQLAVLKSEADIKGVIAPISFEELIVQKVLLTEEQILKAYSAHLRIPFVSLKDLAISSDAIACIPVQFALQHHIVPVSIEHDRLLIALRDPFDINMTDELRAFTGYPISLVLSSLGGIEAAIKKYYGTGAQTVEKLVTKQSLRSEQAGLTNSEAVHLTDGDVSDESMVYYVNQILLEAYEHRATDIHIEPFEKQLRIRYRIDGVLQEAKTPTEVKKLQEAIVSRLKVMANLNISEKRRTQDGRAKVILSGQPVDLRLATFPTLFGEGMCIRLLMSTASPIALDGLGLNGYHINMLKEIIEKPNGIVLVTGPTGCGKSTSLYAFVNYLNDPKVKIVTLEDPVEYQIDGINQIQVNPKIDLTFANGFRSILRQDPDVILVGEIRDKETAQIAIRAALTGHLIFSTLHTNNALASISRLLDLEIEPYLITDTLRAVIAQRLVRCICPDCRTRYDLQEDHRQLLNGEGLLNGEIIFYRGSGCDQCAQTGYQGRIALFELLTVDEGLKSLISSGDPKRELKNQAEAMGMKTLRHDGFLKVVEGITTIEEVLRVTE